jgi:hypothetical protein
MLTYLQKWWNTFGVGTFEKEDQSKLKIVPRAPSDCASVRASD